MDWGLAGARIGGVMLLSAAGLSTAGLSVAPSVGAAGGGGPSFSPALSGDGAVVAFASRAANLVPGDTNATEDVFVHEFATGDTTRVSVAGDGTEADGASFSPSISADGRYVAFESEAANLATGDGPATLDVFVHDRTTGATTLVSATPAGGPGGGPSFGPSLSADGSLVAFGSAAPDLVAGDGNGAEDVFVRDLGSGAVRRVSVAGDGTEGDGRSFGPAISGDGSAVAFASFATTLAPGSDGSVAAVFVAEKGTTTLVSPPGADGASFGPSLSGDGRLVTYSSFATGVVAGDGNDALDAFLHDRSTGATIRVSVASDGTEADGLTFSPRVSADGRRVAYKSEAATLVADDTNGADDVFVHDVATGVTTRVSVASDGTEADGASVGPALDGTGDSVAFSSVATNLAPDDTDGAGDVFVRSNGTTVAASDPPQEGSTP